MFLVVRQPLAHFYFISSLSFKILVCALFSEPELLIDPLLSHAQGVRGKRKKPLPGLQVRLCNLVNAPQARTGLGLILPCT